MRSCLVIVIVVRSLVKKKERGFRYKGDVVM